VEYAPKFNDVEILFFLFQNLRAGNLIGPSMGGEVVSDVTSAPGPVKLVDLQRILSNIGSAGILYGALLVFLHPYEFAFLTFPFSG